MQIDILELAKLCGAFMAIVALGAWIQATIKRALKPIREINEMLKLHGEALCSVIKFNIARAHREYITAERIGRYALQSTLDMYSGYKKLGGNGFVDDLIEELRDLPIVTDTLSR